MRTEEDLLKLFKNTNLDSYKVYTEINETESMQLMTMEELINFSNKHNIDTVFYHYTFINEDALSITEDVTSKLRLDEDTLSILQDKFDKYNESLLNLDFNKPVYLKVYCIYQGIIFFILEEDYWFTEQGFGMPESACLELANKHFDDIVNEKKSKMEIIHNARNNLREQILNDEEFQRCTNIELRKIYANKIFKNNKTNLGLFYTEKGRVYDILSSTFIEDVWREYKGSLKR